MCIDKIFYRFGKNKSNVLLGVTHNSKESLEIINFLLKNYNFKKYLIELNVSNKNFILKNNFYHSEFFLILTKINFINDTNNNKRRSLENFNVETESIKLMDTSLEIELKIFSKLKDNNFYDEKRFLINYLEYKISKYIFYKIWGFDKLLIKDSKNNKDIIFYFSEEIKKLLFFQSHILFRDFIFFYSIKRELLLLDKIDIYKEKEILVKNYFGKNLHLFLKEAEKLTSSINNAYPYENKLDSDKIDSPQQKTPKNQLLVVIGQYHFDNFVKNGLL